MKNSNPRELTIVMPNTTPLAVKVDRGKIRIEYSDVTNYNCNGRGLLTIKGNPAFRQVNKRGYWYYCSFTISWLKETVRWILPLHQIREYGVCLILTVL